MGTYEFTIVISLIPFHFFESFLIKSCLSLNIGIVIIAMIEISEMCVVGRIN
jgi:hypothetical protein